jgi:aspartate kinase
VMLDGDSTPREVLTLLAERSVPGKQLHVVGDRTTVVISRENLHDEDRLREALSTRLGRTARLIDGLGAVSVVGAGINATYENVRAGTATLSGLGITPAALATSSFRITWMVPRDRTADVVRALHARFIESQRPLLPSE